MNSLWIHHYIPHYKILNHLTFYWFLNIWKHPHSNDLGFTLLHSPNEDKWGEEKFCNIDSMMIISFDVSL